jgi:hypothetical protein
MKKAFQKELSVPDKVIIWKWILGKNVEALNITIFPPAVRWHPISAPSLLASFRRGTPNFCNSTLT